MEAGGRPILEDLLRVTGFRLAEKLDRGNRLYCILRRHMDVVRKVVIEVV